MTREACPSFEQEPPIRWLVPCSGRERLGLTRGHVLKLAGDPDGTYLALEDFQTAYPDDALRISGSDGLCGDCFADIMDDSDD